MKRGNRQKKQREVWLYRFPCWKWAKNPWIRNQENGSRFFYRYIIRLCLIERGLNWKEGFFHFFQFVSFCQFIQVTELIKKIPGLFPGFFDSRKSFFWMKIPFVWGVLFSSSDFICRRDDTTRLTFTMRIEDEHKRACTTIVDLIVIRLYLEHIMVEPVSLLCKIGSLDPLSDPF